MDLGIVERACLLGDRLHLLGEEMERVEVHAAERPAELDLGGDHVEGLARTETAGREHGRPARVVNTAGELVERVEDLRRHPHRVDGLVRPGRVPGPAALDADFPRRRRRRHRSDAEPEAADVEAGVDVDTEDLADGPVAATGAGIEYAIIDHAGRAGGRALLVRLEEDAGGAVEVVAPLVEQERHADGDGHVGVVPAEVGRVGHGRGVGNGLGILHRERVELRPVGDGGAGVCALDIDVKPCLREGAVDLEPVRVQAGAEVAGGLVLAESYLRILVEMAAKLDQQIAKVFVRVSRGEGEGRTGMHVREWRNERGMSTGCTPDGRRGLRC